MEIFDVLNEYGEFTGKIATREECHKKGYWHRAVYAFIIDDKWNVLLQKRSGNKKLWPNMWDVTVGGHVDSGEFGRQALIRETKEELGIEISEVKYFSKEEEQALQVIPSIFNIIFFKVHQLYHNSSTFSSYFLHYLILYIIYQHFFTFK